MHARRAYRESIKFYSAADAVTPGAGTPASATVSFSIDNAVTLFSNANNAVMPTLSGPSGDSTSFDWGLPFFFGRDVYIVIEGKTTSKGTGPYFGF